MKFVPNLNALTETKTIRRHWSIWAGWFLVAVTFFAFNVKADTNQIESVRIWPSPNSTRVVIDLKEAPEFTYFSLDNPQRLVVDLKQTKKEFDFSKIANQSNLVHKIRSSKPKNNQSTRLVLELTKRVKPQLFALPPTPPYKNRLVIDLVDPDGPATVVKDAKSDPRG